MNIKPFWINQSKKIRWITNPSIPYIKTKKYIWFPDGEINIYHNCILKNIEDGYGDKTAIYTLSIDKVLKKYSYYEINTKVNFLSNYLISKLKGYEVPSVKDRGISSIQ